MLHLVVSSPFAWGAHAASGRELPVRLECSCCILPAGALSGSSSQPFAMRSCSRSSRLSFRTLERPFFARGSSSPRASLSWRLQNYWSEIWDLESSDDSIGGIMRFLFRRVIILPHS